MTMAEAQAKRKNEAARAAIPRTAGPWTVGRCPGCGGICGMPAASVICLRCQVNAPRGAEKEE